MVIVLIRRCVKKGKEKEFVASYNRQKPNHPDFISETLTKVSTDENLPEPMRNLPISCKDCATYINVAFWKNSESFIQNFQPKKMHDPEIECEDRLRIVLEEI